MSLKFGRPRRLRTRAEFDEVQRAGRRVSTPLFTLAGRPNQLDRDRLGIIASRRLGGAVIRNRAKRRFREIFRRQQPDLAPARDVRSMDLVAIAKPPMIAATLSSVEVEFRQALVRLRKAI